MRRGRSFRWAGVLLGTVGWLLYPVAMWRGIDARWLVRCEHVPFTGEMNSCHNDYLPIVESAWSLVALLMTPLFFRLAIGLLTPRLGGWARWPLGGTTGDHYPIPVIFGGIGSCWAIRNLVSIPMQTRFSPLIEYWLIMCLWFVGASSLYWRERQSD